MENPKTAYVIKLFSHTSLFVFIGLLISCPCFSDGTYKITNENGAYYLETDNDGSWCIDQSLKLKPGQTGVYTSGRDKNGYFLNINNRKIHIDVQAKGQQDIEIERSNQINQEIRNRANQQRINEDLQKEKIKAQERQANADREAYERQAQADREAYERQQAVNVGVAAAAAAAAVNAKKRTHIGVTTSGEPVIIND